MKLIFLDIDGVLNSNIYLGSEAYKRETAEHGITNPFSYEVINKAHHTHLDPSAILLLNQIVDKTQATIILSSTWRIRYSIKEMNEMLNSRGATFHIKNYTTNLKTAWGKERLQKRGLEVADFLTAFPNSPFIILDDVDEFPKYQDQLILIPEETGITQKHVSKAIKLLNQGFQKC